MRRKLLQKIIVILIMIAMMVPAMPVSADGGGTFNQFITGISLSIFEHDGTTHIVTLNASNPSTGDIEVPKDAKILLTFDFALPDDQEGGPIYAGGQSYTIGFPSIFDISALNGTTKDVTADDGNPATEDPVFGVLSFAGGVATLTLSDYVNGLDERYGSFYFMSDLSQGVGEDGQPREIVFQVNATTDLRFNVDFEDPAAASISKGGVYQNQKANWTVTASAGGLAKTGVYVVDTIGPNQTFEADTLLHGSAQIPVQVSPSDARPNYTINGSTLTVYLPDLAADESYAFTYQTTPTVSSGTLENSASLYADSAQGPAKLADASATVGVSIKWVDKANGTATAWDSANRPTSVDWSVVINPESRSISSPTLTDTIPKWLTLDNSSVKLTPQGESAIELTRDAAAPGGYTLTLNGNGTSTLVYAFGTDINKPYTLTYTTTVDSEYYHSNRSGSLVNTAALTSVDITGNNSDTGTVGAGSNMLSKNSVAGSFNFTDRRITWRIVVNTDKRAIDNALITDTIPAGQTLEPGSFTITEAVANAPATVIENEPGGPLIYTPGTPSGGVFEYRFATSQPEGGTSIAKTYVITYKTNVVDVAAYTKNDKTTVTNGAALSSTNNYSANAGATYEINSTVLSKASSAYDYQTRMLTWVVTANQNGIAMPDAVISDTLSPGQTFADGVEVNFGSGYAAVPLGSSGSPTPYYTYDAGTKALAVHLGSILAGQSAPSVRFHTTIDASVFEASNAAFKVTNTASLSTGISGAADVSASVERTINHYIIKKTNASVPAGQYYIDWTVDINLNQLALSDVHIEDQIQAGLELDTSSIKLTRMILNADGTQSEGAQVPLGQGSFSYINGFFSLALPGEPANAAYRLTFTTLVTNLSIGTVANTATLRATGITYSNGPQSTIKIQQIGGGIGYGTQRGGMTLQKTDMEGNPIAQSGVQFALYDQYGTLVRTVSTNSSGAASFTGLTLGVPYSIAETRAPIGYCLSGGTFSFSLSKQGATVTMTPVGAVSQGFSVTGASSAALTNAYLTADILLRKTDMQEKGLPGGKFAVYDAQDTSFLNPLQTVLSGTNGQIVFTGLTAGSYVVRELTPPPGYYGTDEIRSVDVTLNEQNNTLEVGYGDGLEAPLPFKNAPIPDPPKGSISLQKVDQDGAPLAGAVFGLYTPEGALLQTAPSGSDGLVKFSGVLYGTYIIKEISPPAGYLKVSGVSASATVSLNSITVTASPYTIKNYLKTLIPGHPTGDTIDEDEIPTTKPIPQSGGFLDTTVIAALGGLFILAGTALMLRRSRRGKRG
ncbi:MAG: collagen binding domain-containing protein [Bacillota bacterium]